MNRVRSGGDVAGDSGLVRPDDLGAGFDGQVGGDETGGSKKDGNFLAFFLFFYRGGINCGLGPALLDFGRGRCWGNVPAFFGQEEIVDRAVDDSAYDRVNGDPLPNGTFGVMNDLSLIFHV